MATTLATLIATCAPLVHPTTLNALIRVESAGNPYAVSINRPSSQLASGVQLPTFRQPRSATEALRLARILHAQGFTTSIGLAQINSEHLPRFSLQLADLLDPCANLKLAEQLLLECASTSGAGTARLDAILSCFNSGDPNTGIRNGYASRIHTAALANSNARSPR
jgi:type IV secretion system protein VirB1